MLRNYNLKKQLDSKELWSHSSRGKRSSNNNSHKGRQAIKHLAIIALEYKVKIQNNAVTDSKKTYN
jgi:hypothetical protein